jgi:large conductance mechanosensitive channel
MADDIKIVPEPGESGSEFRRREQMFIGASKSAFAGFLDFVRERGVMGLAIGFVLGTSVQKVVSAFVTDIVNPFVGLFLSRADSLKGFTVGQFLVGDFISVTIDFLILVLIVYLIFKGLGLERLDKPKE